MKDASARYVLWRFQDDVGVNWPAPEISSRDLDTRATMSREEEW